MNKRALAQITEEYAAFFLVSLNFEIIAQNKSSAGGELDLIAYKEGVFHVIEVKGRQENSFIKADESLTELKLNKIEQTALIYFEREESEWQIDFVAITYDYSLKVTEIILEENLTAL